MIVAFLILIGIVGGVFSGGIFTIIFIPLGAIMLAVAAMYGMWGRSRERTAAGENPSTTTEPAPLRHTPAREAPAPSRPEELADARRVQQ